MATYTQVSDKRNTSAGMTPNKAIKRGPPPPVKKVTAAPKQMMRRPQGR